MEIDEHLHQGTRFFLDNPVLIVPALIYGTLTTWLMRSMIPAVEGFSIALILDTVIVLISNSFIGLLAYASVISIIAGIHSGRSPGRSLFYAFIRLPGVILISLIAVLLIGIGTLLFVLPGIYLGVRLFLAPFHLFNEQTSALTALGDTWDAMKGHMWELFALLLIVELIGLASSIIVSAFPAPVSAYISLIATSLFLPWSLSVFYQQYTAISPG